MTLQIIGFPRSNFVRTVRMLCHERGVPYEYAPELPHSDAVKAIHPIGQIPVMRHDGMELFESQAIARYIEDAFPGPRLTPADPRAAAPVNQWTAFVATSVDQLLMRRYVVEYAFNKDKDGNVVRTEIDKSVKRMPKMFRVLDAAVAPGHLGGAAFTVADCFLMPILAAAGSFPEGKEMLAASPALSAYFARVSARSSFVETAK